MALTEENSATQQRITELLKRLRRQKQHKKALEEAINTNNKLLTEIEKTSQQNNHIEAQRLQRQVDNATEKQAPLIPPEVVYETTNALSGLNEVLASLNSLFGA
jgi:chromosome segregation ATPase